MNIEDYLNRKREDVDQFLEDQVPQADTSPGILSEAIRYSLLAGGKRIRPILTIAAAEAVGIPPKALLSVACAFECIHTYSLIHDDLPAMDNDDFRRGKPTNHKVYGEAMAILAGDGLQTMAFEFCSRPDLVSDLDPSCQIQIIYELAVGSGNQGMVGGQVLDIQAENQKVALADLQNIHVHKTGRLIRASVRAGALLSGANATQLESLTGYAEDIGLAFQIADDVLNVTGTREELGKDANTDVERGKQTYPSFYGLEGAQKLGQDCVDRAIQHLDHFDDRADPLRGIARYIMSRRS
jgi:geranylgeranyl diphosphate synthase type II